MEKLANLLKEGHHSLSKLVEIKTKEVNKRLNAGEKKVHEVGVDVKKLLPNENQKHVPQALRDPITDSIFELLVFNAASTASYQKEIRKAQLRIGYTILLFSGPSIK
jgi:hypothetical protein